MKPNIKAVLTTAKTIQRAAGGSHRLAKLKAYQLHQTVSGGRGSGRASI